MGNQIKNAEDNAKNAKKRIWTNYAGEEDSVAIEEEEKAALNEDRKVNYTEVLVTEVTDEGKFYACNVSDGSALEKLMDNLREEFTTNPPLSGAYQPKKNDLCAAKFVDDQWYRAKVEKIGVADVQVLYIDYGNRASVPKSKLGSLPATFQTQGGYAKPYSLALTQLPPDEDLTAQAVQGIKEDLLDKTVKLNVEYKTGGESFVSAHIGDEDIGKGLVEDGLLMVDKKGGRKLAKLVKEYDDAMARAKKNHLNIWQYGDITQDYAIARKISRTICSDFAIKLQLGIVANLPVIPVKLHYSEIINIVNFHPIMKSLVTIYVETKFYIFIILLNCKASYPSI